MGPLLFLLYINDLPNCLTNCVPWMYADDTHLTYAGDNTGDIESRLNHDLENVKKWLIANKLTLNMTKTEFMLIGSRQRLYALTNPPIPEINGAPITQVSVAKSLHVYWPEVVAVRTEHSEVRTKTTEGQYSPVGLELARLVSSLLCGFLITLCFVFASP